MNPLNHYLVFVKFGKQVGCVRVAAFTAEDAAFDMRCELDTRFEQFSPPFDGPLPEAKIMRVMPSRKAWTIASTFRGELVNQWTDPGLKSSFTLGEQISRLLEMTGERS